MFLQCVFVSSVRLEILNSLDRVTGTQGQLLRLTALGRAAAQRRRLRGLAQSSSRSPPKQRPPHGRFLLPGPGAGGAAGQSRCRRQPPPRGAQRAEPGARSPWPPPHAGAEPRRRPRRPAEAGTRLTWRARGRASRPEPFFRAAPRKARSQPRWCRRGHEAASLLGVCEGGRVLFYFFLPTSGSEHASRCRYLLAAQSFGRLWHF